MALIPKTTKTNSIADSGISLEVMLVIFAIILIGQKLFEGKVHSWLSWLLLLVMGVCGAYTIFPSNKNHSRIGYFRILYYMRFKMNEYTKKRKLKR